jgi:hypothetical protein
VVEVGATDVTPITQMGEILLGRIQFGEIYCS